MVAASLAVAAGCSEESSPPSSEGSGATGGQPSTVGGGGSGAGIPDSTPISAKATVKQKTRHRLVGDLGQALALDESELCQELGLYDCGVVHAIALGGVDAYGAGIYSPLTTSAVTSPIAVERLVLSACQSRAYRDLEEEPESAAVFVGLEVTDGKLDPQSEAVTHVVTSLFRSAHLREPKSTELEHVRQLYVDIEATGAATPARDWATLSCYAVFTMLESVFY